MQLGTISKAAARHHRSRPDRATGVAGHARSALWSLRPSPAFPCRLRWSPRPQRPPARRDPPSPIAYITDLTGEGGSENSSSPAGFEARLDLQNAQGGVDGHKLVPLVIDDQTSPTEIATAVQEADSKAFGIVSQSPLMFLAAKYPQQAGVPVTGTYDDGPEWGTQPNTNMFASDKGSVNPKYPVNTEIGNFLKAHGGTVLGSYGYGISPSSARAAIQTADSFQHAGGKIGVLDTTVPFGSVDFTGARSWPSRRASTRWCRPWTPTRTTRWRRHSSRPGSS